MTGIVAIEPAAILPPPEPAQDTPSHSQVIRELALDLHCALSRQGRTPFIPAGLPLFDDLQALRQTLNKCLAWGEKPTLHHWLSMLDRLFPGYEAAFRHQAGPVEQIKTGLDRPLPTDTDPGLGGENVALELAHTLGPLADLSPWLAQFRDNLLALSERYRSGLFHCYTSLGLPRTNNDHESLYGQLKRQLRRQLGFSQLAHPLLKPGASTLFKTKAISPTHLQRRLAQVNWQDYFAERTRYVRRQEQFRRRYR